MTDPRIDPRRSAGDSSEGTIGPLGPRHSDGRRLATIGQATRSPRAVQGVRRPPNTRPHTIGLRRCMMARLGPTATTPAAKGLYAGACARTSENGSAC